ncbi:hypothetical protein ACIA8O_25295 [Kitasatospora sp. NPDC051853]|uniref:hypothetical protein n=1 Tax=Kitasatospora sp. NPDC051853 TaxID=3364058 RepID=UPI0037964488
MRRLREGAAGEVEVTSSRRSSSSGPGRISSLIERDEQGRPVAVRRIAKLTADQLTSARQLLADPRQTITQTKAVSTSGELTDE